MSRAEKAKGAKLSAPANTRAEDSATFTDDRISCYPPEVNGADDEAERRKKLRDLNAPQEYSLRDWEEQMRTLDERIPVVESPIDFIDLTFEQDEDTSHVDVDSREDIAVRVYRLSKSSVISEDPSERLAQYVRHVEEEAITMTSLGKRAQRPKDALYICRANAARKRSEEELENLRVIFKTDLRSLFDLLCAMREKRTPILDKIVETNRRCGTLRRNVNGEERILIMRGLADFNPETRSLVEYYLDPDETEGKIDGGLLDIYLDFLHTIVEYNALVAKEVQTIREALANLRGWKSATGDDVRELKPEIVRGANAAESADANAAAAKTAAEGAKESAEGAEQVAKESKSLLDQIIGFFKAHIIPRTSNYAVTQKALSQLLEKFNAKVTERQIKRWEQFIKTNGRKGTKPPDGYTLETRKTLAGATAWAQRYAALESGILNTKISLEKRFGKNL